MLILGNRKSILGGSFATWQYGPSGELTDVRNASFTGATISRYAYTYDAALRRTAVAKSGRAFATEDDISYGYNHRSELTNATAQADSAYRYAYDFDDIGNRKTSAERTAPSISYTANSLNQYTAIDDFVPTYDADGNQTLVKTKTGIWHVTYNGENRPVRWESGTNIITMTYDRMGRRVSKNDQTFIYDGYLQIADNRGSCYIWDPTEPVATRPLVRNNSEFYFHDGNKNVSDILSVTGSVVAHYDYAPFGDCTTVGSNPWRFSSEYSDDDLGLIYYNYRHYDPLTGRWMSRDPLDEVDVGNKYHFLLNSSIGFVDNFGLKVYWSTRDLAKSPLGNHHFITFIYDSKDEAPLSIQPFLGEICCSNSSVTKVYATFGATMSSKTIGTKKISILEAYTNDSSDVEAIVEFVCNKKSIFSGIGIISNMKLCITMKISLHRKFLKGIKIILKIQVETIL